MRVKRSIYIGIGIVLLAGTLVTGTYGLSEADRAVYETAMEEQEYIDSLGFEDFVLSEYTVRFFDGQKDYVVVPKKDGYEIKTDKAVFDTLVGTTYEVDGEYQVIMPTLEQFSGLFGVFETVGKAENLVSEFETAEKAENPVSQSETVETGENPASETETVHETENRESSYTEKEQAAILCHEAFHAYQLSHYYETIFGNVENPTENLIVTEVDEQAQVKGLLKKELALLKQAVKETSREKICEKLLLLEETEEQRRELLSPDVQAQEDYYLILEGTAQYIESMVYLDIAGEEAYEELYLNSLDDYKDGNGKYYAIGMAECLLLDKLVPNWKEGYEFSVSPYTLLAEYVNDSVSAH